MTDVATSSSFRQYWIRTAEPNLPWWPWGWLCLLGLAALFIVGVRVAAPQMQHQTTQSVITQLQNIGVDVVQASGDGQGVSAAVIADPERRNELRAVAESSRCDTWAGNLICPTVVDLTLDGPVADPVPTAAEPDPRFHNFVAKLSEQGLTLTGEVASQTDEQAWITGADAQFSAVTPTISISNEPGQPADQQAQARALGVLTYLERGTASWQNGQLDVEGVVMAERRAAVEAAFLAPENASDLGPRLGQLLLTDLKTVDTCNEEMQAALSATQVQFTTASAEIDQASQPLLQRLADIAQACPGRFAVQGHTDSVGSENANLILSQARAEAVSAALINLGVSPGRITATGLGETQPIGDNRLAAGRAANRRIVVAFEKDSGTGTNQ